VASVITPPVAIAAYAAASIAQGKPIATAVESSRIGAMIFLIPFAFALDPALLLGAGSDAPIAAGHLTIAILSLLAAIYLAASALIGFDCRKLAVPERLVLFVLALTLLSPLIVAKLAAFAIGGLLVARRRMASRATPAIKEV